MSLDRVPGDANLYIGGLFSLRRKEALNKPGITHVVSVLCLPIDRDLFQGYKHLVVEVNDVEDENILQHFPTSNAFIQEGLDGGGGVLVHCAMGRSRSATILIAYLLSVESSLTPSLALSRIRQSRPFAEPNSGFMDQLGLYRKMGCARDLDNEPAYQRWLYQRNVEASNACGVAPDAADIRFGDLSLKESLKERRNTDDPSTLDEEASILIYRCRRCRTSLATSKYTIPHKPRVPQENNSRTSSRKATSASSHPSQSTNESSTCAHLFLDPLSWMRPELEKGSLAGRLECPNVKCAQNVGKYAWQGMKCSCGEWVVPGICIARGKVDEIPEKGKVETPIGKM